jgi:hypothetical protein
MEPSREQNNLHLVWQATGRLEEHFSFLGGTARPCNMSDSKIPLYIGCKLLELNDRNFNGSDYLDIVFVKAANPTAANVNSFLKQVDLAPIELIPFVIDFYGQMSAKLYKLKMSTGVGWDAFGEYLKEKNADNLHYQAVRIRP